MQTSQSDVSTEIADLTGVTWSDLEELPETALAASLRRILRDAKDTRSPLASFQSALVD